MKQGTILFPSLREDTPASSKTFNLFPRISLSHTVKGREKDRDPGNKGDQRSRQADFLSAPDTSLTDSHFAAHAWDSKVSLLTGYLFPEDENQCSDFWEGLEASWSSWIEGVIIKTFICWNENTIFLC